MNSPPEVHRASDLPAAFASIPDAWRLRLPGWTPGRERAVVDAVQAASADREIGPPDPFRALRLLAPERVRVVVFGQDPYPRPGHADGLAFSAGHGKSVSLRRVFDILKADRPGWQPPERWKLDGWAAQGVLMLNPVLTVEIGRTGAHMKCCWQVLTGDVVRMLCDLPEPPVFLLWGRPAQAFFDEHAPADTLATVLRSRHPSQDFRREFMADGSHFAATRHLVDWWTL